MSKKTGEFEFKLGRSGLTFFIFVIAVVLLFSFVSGVMVGKNIESYPQKIAKGIPGAIKETITKSTEIEPDAVAREEKVEFTFYDTLKGTDERIPQTFGGKKAPSPETFTPPVKRQARGPYTIQVASFKDKGMTGALKARLSHMGYTPFVDEVDLKPSGTWFRVKVQGFATYDEARTAGSLLEKKIRGIKCLIIKNKTSG